MCLNGVPLIYHGRKCVDVMYMSSKHEVLEGVSICLFGSFVYIVILSAIKQSKVKIIVISITVSQIQLTA